MAGFGWEYVWSVVAFSFAMSVTPGPNNTITFNTALNYGFFRAMPYMLGVSLGLPVMMIVVSWGLRDFLGAYPEVYRYLGYAGALYILYLSWKIATAVPFDAGGVPDEKNKTRRPAFWNAVLFQWMNPKAWILVLTATTVYVGADRSPANLFFLCTVFFLACFVSLILWGYAGSLSGRFIRSPRVYRVLNIGMGLLLASSVVSML